MQANKKKIRSNNVQLQILVDYMAAHKIFANGEFTGPLGLQKMQQQWEEVRAMLAEHGPDKTVEQWKHTWRDLKKKSRDEGVRIRKARETTGNAQFVPTLSEIGGKILGIIGKECAFGIGDPGETGIGSSSSQPRPQTNKETAGADVAFGLNSSSSQPRQQTNTKTVGADVAFAMNLPSLHSTSNLALQVPEASNLNEEYVVEVPVSQTTWQPPPITPAPPAQKIRTPSQQSRTGLGGRADEFLAAERDTNDILRDILNTMKARQMQSRLKYRQMLRSSRSKHFK